MTLAPHRTADTELYFNVMPFALIKEVTRRSSHIKPVIACEEHIVGILFTT